MKKREKKQEKEDEGTEKKVLPEGDMPIQEDRYQGKPKYTPHGMHNRLKNERTKISLRDRLLFLIPNLDHYKEKARVNTDSKKLISGFFIVAMFLNFLLSIQIFQNSTVIGRGGILSFALIVISWIMGFVFFVYILWFGFCVFLDIRIKILSKQDRQDMQPEKEKNVKSMSRIRHEKPRSEFASRRIKKKQKQKLKVSQFQRQKNLIEFIEKSGLDMKHSVLSLHIFRFSVIFTFLVNVFLFYQFSKVRPGVFYSVVMSMTLWTLGIAGIVFFFWAIFYFYVDTRIYNRTKKIEEVLPDYLHLTSANISAGMPIDRALWYAVRPNFGVLAKEIEDVAKSTLVGGKLEDELVKFTKKYDSIILKRSINLLLEGLESGGEIGDLLNRIAKNIEETRMIKKEMAASVTTYVIFIIFATVVAAPFLFGLSTQLIVIMQSILGNIDMGTASSAGSSMGMMFNISGEGMKLEDYRLFVILCIAMTSTFSTVIITTIQKGNVREGLHLIPIFVTIALVLYFTSSSLIHGFLGGFF